MRKREFIELEIKIMRSGDDLQFVTMHINDWYKIVDLLTKRKGNVQKKK